jgi:hypothetical protein
MFYFYCLSSTLSILYPLVVVQRYLNNLYLAVPPVEYGIPFILSAVGTNVNVRPWSEPPTYIFAEVYSTGAAITNTDLSEPTPPLEDVLVYRVSS